MKKKNNLGFMLTETLIVSTLIITVLLVVYVEFRRVNRRINDSFNYDSVSSMYNLTNIKKYIENENYSLMVSRLDLNDYVEITDCDNYYFSNKNYCQAIFRTAGIDKIYITHENLYSLIKNSPFEENMNEYIKTIKYEKTDGYRLIASFKDQSYANTKVLVGDNYNSNIANACGSGVFKKFTINYLTGNVTIKDPYISEVGCGTTIDINDYISIEDSCYHFISSDKSEINVGIDENLNVANLQYEKIMNTINIYYKNLSNTTISAQRTDNISCGLEIDPSIYKKSISGYKYDHASVNGYDVTLYYTEGSES